MNFDVIVDFFLQLEGPYRWYVIGGVLVILTAIITRFIFKTIKWFLIIVAGGIVIFTVAQYFTSANLIESFKDVQVTEE